MEKEEAIKELKHLLETKAPWNEFDAKRKPGSRMIYAIVCTETVAAECLLVKHLEGYELLESDPNYELISGADWWVAEEYFALDRTEKQYTLIPLSMQTIAPTFGDLLPKEKKTLDRGTYRIRRHLYIPTQRQPVQLELEFTEPDGMYLVEQRLRDLKDPLALKIIYAALNQCQKAGASSFYYYPNKIADILGYKRDKKGYHRRGNIQRIEGKFKVLLDAVYSFEMPWGDAVLKHEGPLLEVSKATMSLIKKGRVLAKAVQISFNRELYQEITERKRFALIDDRCLGINTKKHAKAFLLYSYYSNQLSLGLRQHGRIIRQKLRTILMRSGVGIGKNKARDIHSIEKEHDFLVKEGFATTWRVVGRAEESPDPLDDIWEITMPEEHPAYQYWKEKQKQITE